MATPKIKIVSDERGKPVEVIVPIDLWREIASERETAYLLRSSTMKNRLLAALSRDESLSLEEVGEKTGL